jgi:hypothetical protein
MTQRIRKLKHAYIETGDDSDDDIVLPVLSDVPKSVPKEPLPPKRPKLDYLDLAQPVLVDEPTMPTKHQKERARKQVCFSFVIIIISNGTDL